MSRRCRIALALTLVLVPLAVLPGSAETFLVVVRETEDGTPSRPPFAAREGILAALFDDGHIAFELPAGETPPALEAVPRLGAEAGADTVALVEVDWHAEPMYGGAIRLSCRGSIVLLDVRTGLASDGVPLALGNQDRERVAGRAQLGVEIGAFLIAAWRTPPAGR